jgi:hypothetical protein
MWLLMIATLRAAAVWGAARGERMSAKLPSIFAKVREQGWRLGRLRAAQSARSITGSGLANPVRRAAHKRPDL